MLYLCIYECSPSEDTRLCDVATLDNSCPPNASSGWTIMASAHQDGQLYRIVSAMMQTTMMINVVNRPAKSTRANTKADAVPTV